MKHIIKEYDNGKWVPVEYKTMLDAVESQQIFSIHHVNGEFIITSIRDEYFSFILTADQLKSLGEEIIVIAQSSNEKRSATPEEKP